MAAPGLEGVLADECRQLGFRGLTPVTGGVELEGGLAEGMRACLWLRTATTVRLRLGTVPAASASALERALGRLPVAPYLPVTGPVPVQAVSRRSRLKHTGRLVEIVGRSLPGVEITGGAGGLHLRVESERATLSVDLAGDRLHQRGWRLEGGPAPLRETLAAGLLQLMGHAADEAFVDPMCGSGTLVIEAALAATGRAPGLGRPFAFESFPAFEPARFKAMRRAAEQAVHPAAAPVLGSDRHRGAVGSATRNAERAGVAEAVTVRLADVREAEPPPGAPGLVITNPPYGARLPVGDLAGLYRDLGRALVARFPGVAPGPPGPGGAPRRGHRDPLRRLGGAAQRRAAGAPVAGAGAGLRRRWGARRAVRRAVAA